MKMFKTKFMTHILDFFPQRFQNNKMKERTVSLINSVREMIPIAIKFDLISYHIKINKID